MILYVNVANEIKDVDTTTDETLTPLEVNDTNNPFSGWNTAKICCYKVEVVNGIVTKHTPYIDTKVIEHIDKLGQKNSALENQNNTITETVDSILTEIIPSLLVV